ncbi:methionine/alanine import family NSS transporter small subunit [Agromyces archimandritae]|uniref:Methionine/alanine import family NSS transporter small subunit n=1 Tax=Agromyces archimandritae TaxID=2781962 RepID=A0A975FKS2_9MICO|nr:methionine/alanine import family NSS transporter small subunit [Agromyces archimandritae]QTX03732.1 methionine/alanine import family NSS transporter small subunit [Agromyces archimandritae]
MNAAAIALMVFALLVVWGGMIASMIALGRRPGRKDYPPGGTDDHREDDAIPERDT